MNFLVEAISLQVMAAIGFVGYMVAFGTIDSRIGAFNKGLIILLFSAIPGLVYWLWGVRLEGNPQANIEASSGWEILLTTLAGLLLTILAEAAWKRWGRKTAEALMRHYDISYDDGRPDVFTLLTETMEDVLVSQIYVKLHDGRVLCCDEAYHFPGEQVVNGPMVLGKDGSVALYVQREITPDGEVTKKELSYIRNSDYGDLMTFVPAKNISELKIRRLPKASMVSEELSVSEALA